jgi:glucose/arabinose dehydrogenase
VVSLCAIVFAIHAWPAAAQLRATVYASGFSQPVAFVQDPSDPAVQYVVEKAGIIRAIRNGAVQPTPFLHVVDRVNANGEGGLLGLAFPNDYGASGRLYVFYTRKPEGHIVVARFLRASLNPLSADAGSEHQMLWSEDPNPGDIDSTRQRFIQHNEFGNHFGGCIQFGPDGFLYIATGDGGGGDDTLQRAQDTTELLGKILRINVNVPLAHPDGFVVPSGNPGLPRPEIWSLGLRNPWKFSFDDPSKGGTGAMLIGDVGQSAQEEIDYEPANSPGRNYGWPRFEGTIERTNQPPVSGATPPIFVYGRSEGRSISGGYVYRGAAMPGFRGRYLFADFITGRVWSLQLNVMPSGEASASGLVEHTVELGGGSALGNMSGLGVDAAGELYIMSFSGGAILKVVTGIPTTPTGVKIIR